MSFSTLNASKDIAERAVLLPDGFRFSLSKTRRDWTDESVAKLRKFYSAHSRDGRLTIQPYLLATVRYRHALTVGDTSPAEVAAKEQLNPKYLGVLWHTLTDKQPSNPLDSLRARWRDAAEKDVGPLAAEIAEWQMALWKFVPIGSYRYGATTRQVANDPPASETQPIKLAVKPAPGQKDVVLYLSARDLATAGKEARVVWHRPRFEAAGKPPLLLKDYSAFGSAFEFDHSAVFADTAKYLLAAAALAHDRKRAADAFAKDRGLDPAFLNRWVKVLALAPVKAGNAVLPTAIPAIPLAMLDQKTPKNDPGPGSMAGGAAAPICRCSSPTPRTQ